MDPIGLAVENFDAVGRWRNRGEGDSTIDAAGALPSGVTFTGVAGLYLVLSLIASAGVRRLERIQARRD